MALLKSNFSENGGQWSKTCLLKSVLTIWFSAMHPSTTVIITILLLMMGSSSLAIKNLNDDRCIPENSTLESSSSFFNVYVELGSNQYVDCILGESSSYTSENLKWSGGGDTKKIDSKTLRLYIHDTSDVQSVLKNCVNTASNIGVCILTVKTGTKPMEVENFSCTAMNMDYLDCTWRHPENIKTIYTLHVVLGGRRLTYPCNGKFRGNRIYGCNFTEDSRMGYFKHRANYTLEMTGQNVFGVNNWTYSFSHHSRVWPGAVTHLRASATDSHTVKVSWQPSQEMQANYAPVLRYRISYNSQWGNKSDWQIVLQNFTELVDLQPFTLYFISVSCMSIHATDEALWSPVATVNVSTLPDVPDHPPAVTNGSFFIESSDFSSRNVTLYWQRIYDYHKNGKNFTYHAMAQSLEPGDETEPVIDGIDIDEGSARFSNLSLAKTYLFSIYSVNEMGHSKRSSKLILRSRDKMLDKPESLTVFAIDHSKYNVSWMAPSNASGIEGYTLFYTSTDRLFHKNYKGYLSWKTMNSSIRNIVVTVPNTCLYHYFAVATYNNASSSDMLWNTCVCVLQ